VTSTQRRGRPEPRGEGALFAADVGNRLTKGARFEQGRLAAHISFPTEQGLTVDALRARLGSPPAFAKATADKPACTALAICSGVPRATEAWVELARADLGIEAFVVRGDTPSPLTNRYQPPASLGADRLAAAVAAHAAVGGAAVVVMMGTAITVDAVSAAGEFLGGAIAPGVHTALQGLVEQAAQLRAVRVAMPERAIGRDTDAAMRAGLVFGVVGQVRELTARVRRELGGDAPIVLSGGDAELVADESEGVHSLDPMLVLRGVEMIWRWGEQGSSEK